MEGTLRDKVVGNSLRQPGIGPNGVGTRLWKVVLRHLLPLVWYPHLLALTSVLMELVPALALSPPPRLHRQVLALCPPLLLP